MKRKLMLFLSLLLISVGIVTAQTQVSGVVVDEAGEPIIGATVLIKGESSGTITDNNGHFVLSAPSNAKLIVSYVGMISKEESVKPNLRVVLIEDTQLLDDVVVVAYGTVKKQSLVGAQSSVTAKELENRPITNLSTALTAMAPGVQVTSSSGQPGSSASIRIRGFGSVNASSAPLYVVDGSIYSGNISDISVQDIESISILKDAASTSLYGSSAGNGVVLVTTKSGSRLSKGKPVFTFTSNLGVSQKGQEDYETVDAYQFYPLRWQQSYNDYKYNRNYDDEQAAYWANNNVQNDLRYQPYSGITDYITYNGGTKKWEKTTDPSGNNTYPLIVMPDGSLNPQVNGLLWGDDMDWEKALLTSGFRQEYVLSGGLNTDKMQSFFSLSYLDERGYKKFTTLERYSSRVNITYDINKRITVGTNTSFVRGHTESPKTLGSYSSNALLFMRRVGPIFPIHQHNADGSYVLDELGNQMYDYNPTRPFTGKFNPVMEQSIDKSYGERDAITSRSFADIKLYKGLSFRTNVAYDLLRSSSKTRYNNIMGDQPQGMLTIGENRYSTITFNQLLNYDVDYGDHHINALLGHEAYKYIHQNSSAQKDNMFLLGLDEMSNLVNMVDISSYTNNYRKEGYFGRLNYDFSDRYHLSGSYRYDGSSRFHVDNRWGHFWSVGAGWNIINEGFMENGPSWINNLKLRASIGQTGNDNIGTYFAHQKLFNLGNNNFDNLGLRVASLGNVDLVWEKQTSYDVALEFSLFNKFDATVELFNKESDDLLFSFPLPTSTGVGSIDKNLGKIRNYGLELDLNYRIINTRDFNWKIGANATFFKNEIVTLPEENREMGIESGTKKWMEGRSIYDFYLREFIGVDPADGLAIFRIDDINYPTLADPSNPSFIGMAKEGEEATWTKDGRYVKKHYCGSSIPTVYGGFNSSVSYKGFELGIHFAYQLGGKTYDDAYAGLMGRRLGTSSGSAMHIDMLNAWRNPGDITNVPRLDVMSTNYDNVVSDNYLISANSLMLKSLSFGYSLPSSLLKPLDITRAHVSLTGENLFLFSKRKGLNPMAGYSGVSTIVDYDYAKVLSVNLSFTF